LTAATADVIEPLVRAGRGELRLGVPETAKVPVAAAFAARRESPTLLLVSTPSRAQAFAEERVKACPTSSPATTSRSRSNGRAR